MDFHLTWETGMRIRHSLQKAIIDTLNDGRFTAADFVLELPDSGDSLLKITFRPHSDFKLTLNLRNDRYTLNECPSDFYFSATAPNYNRGELIASISAWVDRIYEELKAMTPVYDDFEDLRQELEKKLDEHISDINTHFTEEEADRIRTKIKEFDQVLEKYAETHAELAVQVASLRRDLDAATETVQSFSKPVWYKTTFNKVASGVKALGRSKEVRALAVDSVKKLVFQSITGVDGES
jgi:hypothetical protein